MGFPLLMAVAFLYPPAIAGSAAFLAASDPRASTRGQLLQALFNRSSIALAVWAAGGVFHALVDLKESPALALVGAALLAAIVDYIVNFGVISIVASLHYRTNPIQVIRELTHRTTQRVRHQLPWSCSLWTLLAKFFVESEGRWAGMSYQYSHLFSLPGRCSSVARLSRRRTRSCRIASTYFVHCRTEWRRNVRTSACRSPRSFTTTLLNSCSGSRSRSTWLEGISTRGRSTKQRSCSSRSRRRRTERPIASGP